jgi:hypothetical protein
VIPFSFPLPFLHHPQAKRGGLQGLLALFLLTFSARGEVVIVDPERADPPGMISSRLLPEQPASRVLDTANELSAQARAELTVALQKAAAKGIEIHTVILAGDPVIEPRKLGNELISRWTTPEAEVGVLVLSLPAISDEPSVFIRSHLFSEVGTDLFATLGQAAIEQSFNQPRAYGASLELAVALPETLEKLHLSRVEKGNLTPAEASVANPANTPRPDPRPEMVVSRWDLFVAHIDPRMVTLLRDCAIGLGGLVLLGATLFVLRVRRPRYFPQVEYRRRFSAPYSGGNNARVATARPAPLVHVPHG